MERVEALTGLDLSSGQGEAGGSGEDEAADNVEGGDGGGGMAGGEAMVQGGEIRKASSIRTLVRPEGSCECDRMMAFQRFKTVVLKLLCPLCSRRSARHERVFPPRRWRGERRLYLPRISRGLPRSRGGGPRRQRAGKSPILVVYFPYPWSIRLIFRRGWKNPTFLSYGVMVNYFIYINTIFIYLYIR